MLKTGVSIFIFYVICNAGNSKEHTNERSFHRSSKICGEREGRLMNFSKFWLSSGKARLLYALSYSWVDYTPALWRILSATNISGQWNPKFHSSFNTTLNTVPLHCLILAGHWKDLKQRCEDILPVQPGQTVIEAQIASSILFSSLSSEVFATRVRSPLPGHSPGIQHVVVMIGRYLKFTQSVPIA